MNAVNAYRLYVDEYTAKLGKYQAEVQAYAAEVNTEVTEQTTKIQTESVRYQWLQDRAAALQAEYMAAFAIPQPAGAGGGAENVKWDLTYSWQNIGSVFPGATSVSQTIDVQNDSNNSHMFDSVATISGSGRTISSMLVCSLTRDVSVANDYAAAAYLLEVDSHFEIDTIGSRQETAK